MTTIDLADRGRRVLKRKHKIIDLSRQDYSMLCEHLGQAFRMASAFTPESVGADSGKYRHHLIPLYEFLTKYAVIGFDKEFVQELMSGLQVEEATPADGIVCLSFNYYTALKSQRYRLTFRSPMAPITTSWPDALIKHGAHPSVASRFETV